MPSKARPLTDAELEAYEAKRDLAAELLQSVREMKAGETEVVLSLAVDVEVSQRWRLRRRLPGGVVQDGQIRIGPILICPQSTTPLPVPRRLEVARGSGGAA